MNVIYDIIYMFNHINTCYTDACSSCWTNPAGSAAWFDRLLPP